MKDLKPRVSPSGRENMTAVDLVAYCYCGLADHAL